MKLTSWKAKHTKKYIANPPRSNSLNKRSFESLRQKTRRKSLKKVHKMDYNLYGIEIRNNRRYRLIDGRIGIAKYKGMAAFAKDHGTHIGVMIEHGTGYHDGTVAGKRYFRCKDGKGDIIRPYQIIEDLGSFEQPITQKMIDDGTHLIQKAQAKLNQYEKTHNIKTKKKQKK